MASHATASAPLPNANRPQQLSSATPQQKEAQLSPARSQEMLKKYRTLPQSTAAAQRDLLIMQARCKVAGQNMDAEFERVRNLLDHYFHLLRDLQGTV